MTNDTRISAPADDSQPDFSKNPLIQSSHIALSKFNGEYKARVKRTEHFTEQH